MTGKHRNIWRMMIVMALLCLAMAIHVLASVKSIMLSAGQKKQLSSCFHVYKFTWIPVKADDVWGFAIP